SAVRRLGSLEPEPFHHGRSWNDSQEGGRFDPAQDVMLNQNAAQRGACSQDFCAHRWATVTEIDARDTELHNPTRTLQSQQNLACIRIAVVAAGEDAHVNQAAVVSLHGDGHVVLVDQQAMIRGRDLLGTYHLAVGQVAGWAEESK